MATIEHGNHGSGIQNNNTGSGNQYITNNYDAKAKADRFLADLRDGITDPRDDKLRIEDTKGGLLRESYYWIFENEDFKRWKNDQACRLLWIRGDPGKGKTMLVCGIIDELKEAGEEPIFFFCQASDSNLSKAKSVLRGLLYVLLDQRKDLVEPFLQKHDHVGKQMFEDKNSWVVLHDIITATIHKKSEKRLCLIVDALDECTSGLSKLLGVLVKLSSIVRIIVTSRNRPSIEIGMAADKEKVEILLELNEDEVSAAVDYYIRHKVYQLALSKSYDDSLREEVQSRLTSNSNQTFLWVALVCQQLADIEVAKRHTRTKLTEFPQELNSLYEKILRHILDFRSPDRALYRNILAALSIAYRPLSLSELGAILHPIDYLPEIVAECNSLLTVKEDIIYFVHESARQYLRNQGRKELMPSGESHEHSLMVSYSLKAMKFHLRTNMRGLVSPGALFRLEDSVDPDEDPLDAVAYSCANWLKHLKEGNKGYEELAQVYEFLAEYFLQWVEALSLLRGIQNGIDGLGDLQYNQVSSPQKTIGRQIGSLFQLQNELPNLEKLAVDGLRFLQRFRLAIEHNPMQVYSSLVFGPSKSLLRKVFRNQEPDWIVSKPSVDEEWSLCIETIEHQDAVTCLAVSLDSYQLATVSKDRSVYVRFVYTGYTFWKFKLNSTPASLVFSPNGSNLAIWFLDGSLEIWNVDQQNLVRVTGPGDGLNASASLVYSKNGNQIMLASKEHIQLLCALTGRCLHILKLDGLDDAVTVSYVAGDDAIASISKDGISMLWQISSNSSQERMMEASHSTRRAFCANGSQIVLVAGSHAKYWDTMTGKHIRTLSSSVFESSSSVFFSRDGKRIACAGASRPITLLDSDDGRILGTLEGYFDVSKLVFLDDNDMVATASDDGSVRLWDLMNLQSRNLPVSSAATFQGDVESSPGTEISCSTDLSEESNESSESMSQQEPHIPSRLDQCHSGGPVLAVVFSVNGTQIASVSLESFIIWDAHTGLRLQTFEGIPIPTYGKRTHYTLHLDGDQVLLATWRCKIVEIWDVKARILQQQWETPGCWTETSMVFSSNATFLAAALEGQRVYIWEVTTGLQKGEAEMIDDVFYMKFLDTTSYTTLRTDLADIVLREWDSDFEVSIEFPDNTSSNGQSYYYEPNGDWITRITRITRNWENLLWLPPEYRTEVFAIKGSAIALGCKSGRTALLRFK